MLLVGAGRGVLAQPPTTPFLRIEPGMHTDQVRRIVATADGETLITASADKTLRVWGADGTLLRTLRPPIADGHEGALRAAAVSSERRLVAVGGTTGAAWGRDAQVYLLGLDRDRMQRLPTGVPAEITALAFAPGGARLAIGFQGQAGIAVFDFASSELVTAPTLGVRGGVTGMVFDEAGNLAVGAGDGHVHLFSPRLQPLRPARLLPEGGQPGDLAFSPDGRLLAVGLANMPVVRLFDARTLEPRGAPPLGAALGRERQNLAAVAWTMPGPGQQALHAAGYVLDAQGRSAALRWTNLTAPPGMIVPLGSDTVFHLTPLPGGLLAYAGGEPAWGVVGGDGRHRLRLERQGGDFRSIAAGLFRARPDETDFGAFPERGPGGFRLSHDGMIVEFGMEAGGRRVLRFDAGRRAIEPVASPGAPDPAFRAAPSVSLPLRDWLNGATPAFRGRRLRLEPGEVVRSVQPLPASGGFLLGTDTHLRRFDGDGAEIARIAVHAAIWGVQVSGDGGQAVLAMGDGTLRWHDLDPAANLTERAALFVHRDGRRWILWTPEGFFDHADQGGQDLAGYHINRRAQDLAEWVNFAQLYRVFYAEDLVRLRLLRGDETPLRERLAAIGNVRRWLQQSPAPGITIAAVCFVERPGEGERCHEFGGGGGATTRGLGRLRENARPQVVSAANATVIASATAPAAPVLELPAGVTHVRLRATLNDRGGGIGQTDLLLNERNVGRAQNARGLGRIQVGQPGGSGGAGGPLQDAVQTGLLEYSRVVELDPGRNTLQLRAFEATNESFGQSAVLELRAAPARAAARLPTLHVLAIGVDDYAATVPVGLRSLLSAVADAQSVIELLERRMARDYGRFNPILIQNDQASLSGIEAAFERLHREAAPEDTVVVYLAGHGLAQADRYLFIPFMSDAQDLEAVKAQSLDDRRLIALWSAVAARNTLLLIDTCHAGAFNMDFAGALQNETGRLVLAAASAQQEAADRVPGTLHGPFALAVQQALRGEVSRRPLADGIDQLTLGFHVRDRVPDLARRAQVEQRVSFRLSNGEVPSPFLLTRQAP